MSLAAGDRMEAERDLLDFRPATAQTTDASANDGAVAGAPGRTPAGLRLSQIWRVATTGA